MEATGGVGTECDCVALVAVVVPEAVQMSEMHLLSARLHWPTFFAVGLSLVPLGGPGLRVSGRTTMHKVRGVRESVCRLLWFGSRVALRQTRRTASPARVGKLELRLIFQTQTVSGQKKSGVLFASVRGSFILASVHASSW